MLSIVIIFTFGLVVGSFLNVLIDRLPKGQNPFAGRSKCDFCKKTLSPLELIPLLSFVVQKGCCRSCHRHLSMQYPIVELVTGVMFILLSSSIISNQQLTISNLAILFSLLIIFSSLLVIFVADLKYQIIPDEMIVTLFVGTLFYHLLWRGFSHISIYENLLSALGVSGFFAGIYYFTRGRGMGFGDVKLAFPLGFLLGFPQIVVALYMAFLTGALISLILILGRKKQLKSRIAFGPFLVAGTIISLFLGRTIIQWYTSFFQ